MRLNMLGGLHPFKPHVALKDAFAGVPFASMNIPQVLGHTRIAGTPVVTVSSMWDAAFRARRHRRGASRLACARGAPRRTCWRGAPRAQARREAPRRCRRARKAASHIEETGDAGVAEDLRNVHRRERYARESVLQSHVRLERMKPAKHVQSHRLTPVCPPLHGVCPAFNRRAHELHHRLQERQD